MYYDLNQNEIHDLVQVFGLRGKVKGLRMTCLCPFHKDTVPSLSINLKTGQYNCWSCEAKGNLYTLSKEMTGKPLRDWVDTSLFEKRRYTNMLTKENKVEERRDGHYVVRGGTQPLEMPVPSTYIQGRGLSVDFLKKVGAFYLPYGSIGIDEEEESFLNFSERLIIPIHYGGDVVSYEGRAVGDRKPKVLYPRESNVSGLYDFENLDRRDTLYVVEGLMDLMNVRPVYPNSTSIFGAKVTEEQQKQLREFPEVVIMPDNDEAGEKVLSQVEKFAIGELYIMVIPKKYEDPGKVPQEEFKTFEIKTSAQYFYDKHFPKKKLSLF
jgi:DNA primase